MGKAHAKAYYKIDEFNLVGLVARSPEKRNLLSNELGNDPQFDDFDKALKETKADMVSIN